MRADFKDRNSHMRFYSDIMNKQRTYLLDSHFENVNGSRFVLLTRDKKQLKDFFHRCIEIIEKDEANDKILQAGGLQLYYDGYEDAMRTAVEIVKGGGVE